MRYGNSFGNKFYNLFEDYPMGGRRRRLTKSRLQTAYPMNSSKAATNLPTTAQKKSRLSNRTTPGWQFRSFSSNQNYQSAELPGTNVLQLKRRLLDV
jgi:hypothetical protein